MRKFIFINAFSVAMLLHGAIANAQSQVDRRDTMVTKSMSCHCFGEIECWGFTGALGSNFSWPCKTSAHDAQCCDRVKAAYNDLSSSQKQVVANCLCAKGMPNGYELHVKQSVGTESSYSDCGKVATLINTPAVIKTTCTCPAGWLANQTNVDGGITADGKCKKAVCGPISVPTPAGYTAVGDWGFIGGSTLYAWGSDVNGGKAICVSVQISPAVCKLQ